MQQVLPEVGNKGIKKNGRKRMKDQTHQWKSLYLLTEKFLFPVLLVLFPLLKANQGIDLTDTAYSLGNYVFFGENTVLWTLLTFLSNLFGFLLTKLPFGGTMLGMKVYTSLLISGMALLGYRFFRTKMPAAVAFLAEIAAIGMCWCPSVILYNYMTYVLLLVAVILLFRGLVRKQGGFLLAAGIVLGFNTFVRFPNNGLEVLLILALWYYGYLKKKTFAEIAKETGICIAGYLAGFVIVLVGMMALYGAGTLGTMIEGVFGMAGSASDYTFGEMVGMILDAYLHGARWMAYMVLCILPGVPFFAIQKERFLLLRKVIYCGCIAFLFLVLGKWGMFNFKYYQKESALQWGVIFLILSLIVCGWMMLGKMADCEWKLIASLSLIVILITPLGSNNYVWPALNNLFFVAPVTFWMIYRLARWGRPYLDVTEKVPVFSVKAMTAAMVLAFLIQAIGIGCHYVFLDGEDGLRRDTEVAGSQVLQGMKTNAANAATLQELNTFILDHEEYQNRKLILYGNIPGVSYYLNMAPAVYTTWADLDTNSLRLLQEDLDELSDSMTEENRPLVIFSEEIMSQARELQGGNNSDMEVQMQESVISDDENQQSTAWEQKLSVILNFMDENSYEKVFENEKYVVFK